MSTKKKKTFFSTPTAQCQSWVTPWFTGELYFGPKMCKYENKNFILEDFDTFQENSNISQRTFNWLVIVFPDHILHISIVTSVLWNKESFFLNLFQGILFKMYSIILKNTVSGSLYWLKFKSQFDLTEHFNLKESLDYHITLAPLWFIN